MFVCVCQVWKLNVAHVFFMEESKFKDAIRYYDPIVKKNKDNLLDVTAIVLGETHTQSHRHTITPTD